MRRHLLTAMACVCAIAAAAGLVFMRSGAADHARRPSYQFLVVIDPRNRAEYEKALQSFAATHNFDFVANTQPETPLGNHYVFEMAGPDMFIFTANRMKSYTIDPNGHGGAPPPEFDPATYDVAFYENDGDRRKGAALVQDFVMHLKQARNATVSVEPQH